MVGADDRRALADGRLVAVLHHCGLAAGRPAGLRHHAPAWRATRQVRHTLDLLAAYFTVPKQLRELFST
ncbi:MAG: hypothetical protein IPF71_16470, partial [Rhodoferax sp.]|nr:hypothetical protein [Rhodoferax sp.]